MKRRVLGLGFVMGLTALVGASVVGCSSQGDAPGAPGADVELGTLSVPLVTEGVSGTKYRLRDATFRISNTYYYYDDQSAGGYGGASPQTTTVSSEDDPDAANISVSVERGYYYVTLLPGWHLEKIEAGEAEVVEATLLSPAAQWLYVSQHSTSWVTYEFGLGDRSLWFNGQLNLEVRVRENPSELYGGGGGGVGNDYGAGGYPLGGDGG